MEDSFPVRKRRSGLLNVWTAPSLEEAVPDSTPVSTELGKEEEERERMSKEQTVIQANTHTRTVRGKS